MPQARVRVPAEARRGEVIEIRTMIQHPMETGFRRENDGSVIPVHIIHRFTCTYNGEEVFAADLHPAIAANPYLSFYTLATESGRLEFRWFDDDGGVYTETAEITAG